MKLSQILTEYLAELKVGPVDFPDHYAKMLLDIGFTLREIKQALTQMDLSSREKLKNALDDGDYDEAAFQLAIGGNIQGRRMGVVPKN